MRCGNIFYCYWLWLCVVVVLVTDATTSEDDDTFSSYIGFNNLAPMPIPLSNTVAVLFKKSETVASSVSDVDDLYYIVPEDRIYLFGGCTSDQTCMGNPRVCTCTTATNKCMFYRPLKNNWGECASAPVARYGHTWAKVRGKVYIVGGMYTNGTIVQKVDIYNPINDAWDSNGIVWPEAVTDAVAWGSDITRSVYVAGGFTHNNVALNTVTRLDTVLGSIHMDVPNMLHARGAAQLMKLGSLYHVMGGYETRGKLATGACSVPTHWNEAYDSLRSKWVQLPDMLYGRAGPAMGSNGKNLLFVIAGETVDPSDSTCSHVVPVSNVGLYNSTSSSWSTVDSLPSSSRFRYTSTSYYNGSFVGIYLFGGTSTFDPTCGCPPGASGGTGCGAGCFRVSDVSTLYVPVSLYSHHVRHTQPPLSAGAIAGVVIAGLTVAVVCGCVVFAVASRYAYRYMYVRAHDEEGGPKGGAAYELDVVPSEHTSPESVNGVREATESRL